MSRPTELKDRIAAHPRLLGVLWTLVLLLAETLPVLADGGTTKSGP